MRSRATEEFDDSVKPFKEKSHAAKGLRKSDTAEVMSTPPEGYRAGTGRDSATGRMFNQVKKFADDVAKPARRYAGKVMAGLGAIGTVAEIHQDALDRKMAVKETKRRDDVSGGPDANISSKGSSINPKMELPKSSDKENLKSATSAYDKWKSNQKTATQESAPAPIRSGNSKKSKGYSHDITDSQKKTIRNQAIDDMRKRASKGDSFWKGQLEKALARNDE